MNPRLLSAAPQQRNIPQRGNMLFIILLAVALFGALGFAMTMNRQSFLHATTQEEARIAASEMIQYGDALRGVVDKLILLNGAEETNTSGHGILFAANGASTDYDTPGDHPRTEVFNARGGGAAYQTPPKDACTGCTYEFTGQIRIDALNDPKYELSMTVPDINKETCGMVNTLQKNHFTGIPTADALSLERFDGNVRSYGDLTPTNAIRLGGDLEGKRSFCYQEDSGAERYIFVHVLHVR